MRILALMTEAFGGRGGIAEYNRNWIQAMAGVGGDRISVLTRLVPAGYEALPPGVEQRSPRGGKAGFAIASLASAVAERPDVLFCGHIHLLPLAALVGWILRIPVWLQVHGIDAWTPLSHIYRAALRRVTLILSVSEYTRRRLLEWAPVDPERIRVVPNTYDEATFRPGLRSPDLARRLGVEGRTVILSVGRLDGRERYKGQDRIIELLPRLRDEIPDVAFIIAGDGDDRSRLERLAQDLGVAELVRFAGFIAHRDLPDLYRLADVFVLAGYGEGFGIVLLEAMACGVPVIASTRDGSREAVLDGALGAVVDPDDAQILLNAILAGLLGPKTAPEAVQAAFGLTTFGNRLLGLVEQLEFRKRTSAKQ